MNQSGISRRRLLGAVAGFAAYRVGAWAETAASAPRFRYARPIIDAHAHLRVDLLDDIVKVMDAFHIEKAVTLSMPIPWADWTTEEGAMALAKHLQPDRIIFFSTVDIKNADNPNFGESEAARIEECVRNGAQGIKMYYSARGHPFSWFNLGLDVNDRRMLPIYAVCGELNIPLLVHLGGDEATIAQLIDAAKKRPKTNFIAAHAMGRGREPDFLAARLKDNPNLYIDTATVFARAGQQDEISAARKLFSQHAERVVFGTDPVMSIFRPGMIEKWRDLKLPQGRNAMEGEDRGGLNLPDDILDKVYSRNITRLVGQGNPISFSYFRPILEEQVRALENYLRHPMPELFENREEAGSRKPRVAMVPAEIEHFLAFVKKYVAKPNEGA
ncbi:MAG: amidohydrolase family protein [Candidatus Sumerlaeota bacterium]|nr:amidohydrolase family protein [Candidatus Sumerlaeota bacterium]